VVRELGQRGRRIGDPGRKGIGGPGDKGKGHRRNRGTQGNCGVGATETQSQHTRKVQTYPRPSDENRVLARLQRRWGNSKYELEPFRGRVRHRHYYYLYHGSDNLRIFKRRQDIGILHRRSLYLSYVVTIVAAQRGEPPQSCLGRKRRAGRSGITPEGRSGYRIHLGKLPTTTEAFHLGLALGKVPVRISRNKSHKYRGFRPIIAPPTPSK